MATNGPRSDAVSGDSWHTIDPSSPMPDVVAALKRADYNGCYEFCRRQQREALPALVEGMATLRRIVYHLQCQRPDELMAWKFPETYDAVPGDVLPSAMQAACQQDDAQVYATLADLSFAHLAACGSAAAHLRSAATHLIQYGHRERPADPQERLFD